MKRRVWIVVTILLVLAALVGPLVITLGADRGSAAFGDNETFGLNQLESATVSASVGPNTILFDARAMAPGDRFAGHVVVENDGSLPLRYSLLAEPSSEDRGLLAVLEWSIWPANRPGACGAFATTLLFDGEVDDGVLLGDPSVGEDPGDRLIQPGATEVLCVEVVLPLDVSNAFQGASAVVDLTILAEQATEVSE